MRWITGFHNVARRLILITSVFREEKTHNRLRLFALQEDTFGLPALQHIYNGVCNPVFLDSWPQDPTGHAFVYNFLDRSWAKREHRHLLDKSASERAHGVLSPAHQVYHVMWSLRLAFTEAMITPAFNVISPPCPSTDRRKGGGRSTPLSAAKTTDIMCGSSYTRRAGAPKTARR